MSLHTEIKQFLAAVKDPASLTTTRVSLEQAVGLLKRIENAQYPIAVIPDGVDDFLPIFDMDMTPPKPEDKL